MAVTPPRAPASVRADLFGGSGEVRVHDLLAGGAAGPFTAALWCSLAPGGSVGRHRQEQFPEIVMVIAGEGTAEVEGVGRPLFPGAVVYVPLGAVLSLRNCSNDEPLDYAIIKARS